MKKRLLLLASVVVVLSMVAATGFAQIFAPEGLNMPGTWDGFSNPPTVAALAGIQGGGTVLPDSARSQRYHTKIHVDSSGGDIVGGTYTWLFTSGPGGGHFNNKWADVNVTLNTVQTYTKEGATDNSITMTNGMYYTMNYRNTGYANTEAIFMETSGLPVTFTSVAQTPLPGLVTDADPVTVDVTVNADPSAEENFYLRYSVDNFVTSNLVPITIASQAGSAIIPPQTGGTTVKYEVFSTTLTTPSSDFDIVAINYDNDAGSYYDYSIPAPVYTIIASSGPGGSIDPSGSVPVNAGDDTTFSIISLVGYTGDQLIIDGIPQPFTTPYTFTNVQQNHTIHATHKASVTFQVNMKVAAQSAIFDPTTDFVMVRGSFNGWGDTDTLEDGNNDSIYTKTLQLSLSQSYAYKYFKTLNAGVDWETFAGDRNVDVDTLPFAIPPVYFSNVGPDIDVTFQVDMSVKILEGVFDPGSGVLTVRGNFNDWGNSTNNPDTLYDGDNDSIYTRTVTTNLTNLGYKFWTDGLDYETIADRQATTSEVDTTLPVVYFDDDAIVSLPAFSVAPPSVNFGNVVTGDSASAVVKVYNTGFAPLTISAVVSDDASFEVDPASGVVSDGDSASFTVTFKPTLVQAYSGNIEFTHDAAGSPDTVTVSGSGVVAGPSPKFLSVPPETLYTMPGGKFPKPVKRAKPGKPIIMPNWANLMSEAIAQGAFGPGTLESDSAGGMVIGVSHMFLSGPNKWKPVKDSAKVMGWVRITKYDFKKNVGKGFNVMQKTLNAKGQQHTAGPRGFDQFANAKPFVKQLTKLLPKKQDNKLFPELLALKFNIGVSALGKTPAGFGDLIFERTGNPYDQMSVYEISQRADSMMTYWAGYVQEDYDSLFSTVADINRAFVGGIDTVSWMAADSAFPLGKLVLAGVVEIDDVPFLSLPSPFVPSVTTPSSYEVESEEDTDFDDDEEFENLPIAAKLYQNYPNPFNPSTRVAFRLREDSKVSLKIYNMLGQEVASLLNNEEMEEGVQMLQFNANGLSSGVYFYRIQAEGLEDDGFKTVETGKMVLLK